MSHLIEISQKDGFAFAFVHMPKAASQSIQKVMQGHFGTSKNDVTPNDLTPFYTFSVCRNPYDRACSVWWSTTQRGDDRYSFKKRYGSLLGMVRAFVDFEKPQPKIRGPFTGRVGLIRTQCQNVQNIHIDRFLRFEHLDAEWKTLSFMEGIDLPVINTTERPRWPFMMSREIVSAINEYAADDFKRFGYYMMDPEGMGCVGNDD